MARGRVVLAFCFGVLAAGLIPVAGGANQADVSPGKYIVMLAPGVDPTAHARTKGISVGHSYRRVFHGYSAALSPAQVQSLQDDPEVTSVKASRVFHLEAIGFAPAGGASVSQKDLTPQVPSVSARRVGALLSPTAKIDGIDERVDVDIAILDSGIQPDHPDLNVRGGTDCVRDTKKPSWADRDGHGTLVAGIAAAIDNGFGRVGIAPGARLWGVRVADPEGLIEDADLICGLEWLVAGEADIEVANMSLSGPGENINACRGSSAAWDALQYAICAAVGRGITMVASAGNEGMDASTLIPGAYPDVMAVSAFAETDGLPGRLGPSSGSLGCEVDIADDTFAFFSNFGPTIDLSAPGVCVGSTFLKGTYAGGIGTSFSTPLVAGAAALYLAKHPDATPDRVRDALLKQRERGPIAGDPDGIDEGILNVSGL
jgi:subtilisin family serine protease